MATKGGGLSKDQAKAKWTEQSTTYEEKKIVHDFLSPNTAKPLRLRVHTGDMVNFVNRDLNIRQLVGSEAAVKKSQR